MGDRAFGFLQRFHTGRADFFARIFLFHRLCYIYGKFCTVTKEMKGVMIFSFLLVMSFVIKIFITKQNSKNIDLILS